MNRIWEFSPRAVQGREKAFEADLRAREELLHAVATKQVGIDTFIMNPKPDLGIEP
jgi:hypothetical protein